MLRSGDASPGTATRDRARALAAREGCDLTYRVIYQLTEDIEQALVGMLKPVETEETLGEAEVRQLFKVSRLGTIAGCMVTSGIIRRGAQARVIRDGTVIQESTITQLKRFKDDAREVAEGFECPARVRHADDAVGRRDRRRSSPRCARRFPKIHAPKKEDICYATSNRQWAVKEMLTRSTCCS